MSDREKSNMRKSRFALDMIETSFEGFTFGDYWNGFDCPYFTKEQADIFLAFFNKTIREEDLANLEMQAGSYNEEKDSYEFPQQDYVESFEATVIDGEKFYPIGAWGWTWQEVSEGE